VALLEAALAAAGDGRTATRARLLSVLAAELAFSDDLERRRDLCDEALAIARELDDPRALGQVLSCRFDAVRVPATAEERDRSTAENLALTESFDDPIAHWFAVTDRLTVAVELALPDEVDRYLTEEVELADELQGYQRWIALVHQAWHALVTGRFADGESYNDQALQLGTETGQPDAFVLYAAGLFLLRDAQGRWEELIPAMEQSIAENPDIAGFRACLAQSYAETGQHDDARRMLRAEAATDWESVPRDVVWATALCLFGNVAATIGATEEAPALLELLAPYVHLVATDGAHVYQPIALVAGRLATLLGRAEADPWLRQAEDVARRFDAPVWLAEARLARSRLTGDHALAHEALATVERLGPTAVGHRTRHHLGLA
jgi:tetratricopeptide (TPR) repeat protein